MIGIYRIISPTGRVYVGQSVDTEKRFSFYRSIACKSQPKLYRSLLKYGHESHVFEVIKECEISELNNYERYYQEFYNTITEGLNCMYIASSNAPAKRSDETKKKIGDFNLGKKRSKEDCEKISAARKGMKFSESHCENIRQSKTGVNNKRSKAVINTLTKEIYPCIADAALKNNLDHRTLSKYLLGQRTNKTNLAYVA